MTVPAGWYADPQSPTYYRWWDGQAWTDQIRPVQMSSADQQASTHAEIADLAKKLDALRAEEQLLRLQLVETSDAMILQEVGIYHYQHPLDDAAAYKDALEKLEQDIKACVKG